jgi:hypothetical protein
MVNLLLPERNVAQDDAQRYKELVEELTKFNQILIKDAADMILVTDDKRDMRTMLLSLCESWKVVAKRLLEQNMAKPLSAKGKVRKE